MAVRDERLERAEAAYERAVFGGDPGDLPGAARDLDAVAADLALARGKLRHARVLADDVADRDDAAERALFEQAAGLYQALGDPRGEGEATVWIGIVQQVLLGDDDAAVPLLESGAALAERAGDALTRSYALRHLGIAAHRAGRLDDARAHLEASTELRRSLAFDAGVAANLVGLAYIAAAQDRADAVEAILDEARAAASPDAEGVLRQVDEARANLLA